MAPDTMWQLLEDADRAFRTDPTYAIEFANAATMQASRVNSVVRGELVSV